MRSLLSQRTVMEFKNITREKPILDTFAKTCEFEDPHGCATATPKTFRIR